MKIWSKIKVKKNNCTVKKYKLFGITVFRKENSPSKKLYSIFGIKFGKEKKNKKTSITIFNFKIRHTPIKKLKFPLLARSYTYKKSIKSYSRCNRIAIFASFSSDCRISEYVIYYIKELKKVCDAIIFVADNPVLPNEIDKIKDLVIYASFDRHKEYDFGSYKRGYAWAKKNKLLTNCDELILCNDSCYGPIYPLVDIFDIMKEKKCDFWGMVQNSDINYHLQSYFIVFRKKILKENNLYKFLSKVKKEKKFWNIVFKYEMKLTHYLQKKGYVADAFIPLNTPEIETACFRSGNRNKTLHPLTMIKNYNFPFIKVKCFTNGFDFHLEESPETVLNFLKQKNKTVYDIIISDLQNRGFYKKLNDNNVYNHIENADIVSFDVFDTLLIRPYVNPTDLFLHMEKHYEINGFYKARIDAEHRARLIYKNQQDITLDQIYEQILPQFYDYKNKEVEFETKTLMQHPLNYKIYQKAVELNKKIIITSDMYLPTNVIKNILKINGYNKIDKIYVSGDYNKSKGSGDIFKQIIADFNIEPSLILHIGDNEISDIKKPEVLGIKTFLVKKYFDWFSQFYGSKKFTEFYHQHPCLERSIIVSQIAIHSLTDKLNTYWNEVGYCIGGPLACGYIHDIIKQSTNNNIDTLLFVARDGYILQKVYNKISPTPLDNHYIYAPRILNLKCFGDYKDIKPYKDKLKNILSDNIVSKEDAKKFVENKKVDIDTQKTINNFFEKNKTEYEQYVNSLNIKGNKVASVDMTTGAYTSQSFLQNFFKNKYVMGFFSATFCDNVLYKHHSYMKDIINPITDVPAIILTELLITAPELPIKDVKNSQPIYANSNSFDEKRKNISKEIEYGILKYVDDYINNFYIEQKYAINFSFENILELIKHYCKYLSCYDTYELKEVKHAPDATNEDFISLYDEIVKLSK